MRQVIALTHTIIHMYLFYLEIYRMCINYRRISLRHNLSRRCRKIVKFVSITHSERNIWNGPIVATAIGNVTQDMLERVWREWEYRLDIYRVTCGAHIECIWVHYETANIPLSNDSNIMYFCSVFAKSSDNLYTPCMSRRKSSTWI